MNIDQQILDSIRKWGSDSEKLALNEQYISLSLGGGALDDFIPIQRSKMLYEESFVNT